MAGDGRPAVPDPVLLLELGIFQDLKDPVHLHLELVRRGARPRGVSDPEEPDDCGDGQDAIALDHPCPSDWVNGR